jgi:hypothetical protein
VAERPGTEPFQQSQANRVRPDVSSLERISRAVCYWSVVREEQSVPARIDTASSDRKRRKRPRLAHSLAVARKQRRRLDCWVQNDLAPTTDARFAGFTVFHGKPLYACPRGELNSLSNSILRFVCVAPEELSGRKRNRLPEHRTDMIMPL